VVPLALVVAAAELASPLAQTARRDIAYDEVELILEGLRAELLPEELRSRTPGERRLVWPDWVVRHDRAIRARVENGDRDSVVNFMLFGTTFTRQPRPTAADLLALDGRREETPRLFTTRIDDFIVAAASPGDNERLQFARRVLEGLGFDQGTASGRERARAYLAESLRRSTTELKDYATAIQAARQRGDSRAELMERTVFRDRGLASDTSILVNFALHRALEAIKGSALLAPGAIRRVGIVGPGLDFTDKHDGHDFYPQQTIQPFVVFDTLVRLHLAKAGELRVATFDLNPRINQHLDAARRRADAGHAYLLSLPRNMDSSWNQDLVEYWEQLGAEIGERGEGVLVPRNAGNVHVRTLRIRPSVVRSIDPVDLNIVLQRFEPLSTDERFDLIVATDVLIYYDVFEQSLALANIARLLRPGGFLLSNNPVFELPGIPMSAAGATTTVHVAAPVGQISDRVVWYRRQ
jgi:SAM-dependent methyltransferase